LRSLEVESLKLTIENRKKKSQQFFDRLYRGRDCGPLNAAINKEQKIPRLMEKVSISIIGAGAIGLAIAERLSKTNKNIIVFERHESFGKEASSRNSEVIHAGIYYPTQTLKTTLCVVGRRMLYSYMAKENIPHKKIGKLIIANNDAENDKIEQLFNLSLDNGVEKMKRLSSAELPAYEANISALNAIYSPETGIFDSHMLMKSLEKKAENAGAVFAYGCRVKDITKENGSYRITALDTDGEDLDVVSEIVVNCAGCGAGEIARTAGVDIKENGYTIYPCKGEYFKLATKHRNKLKHLVYPAPTKISLGIHTVLDLGNGLKLGPNAYYVDDPEDYKVNNENRKEFFDSAKTYLPFIEEEDLTPDMAGVRPKTQPPNDPSFKDFIIREESDKGLSGMVNLIGIESPGLTSCLAIAEYVENKFIN
jgi:L-2-hydroxyglutarate oxidase LhgO